MIPEQRMRKGEKLLKYIKQCQEIPQKQVCDDVDKELAEHGIPPMSEAKRAEMYWVDFQMRLFMMKDEVFESITS